jgi:hypothetical protein
MFNYLYKAIIDKVRRIPKLPGLPARAPGAYTGAATPVVPFATGRIYKCTYTNYHHDPRPLLFILSSDYFHTNAINIHYLGGMQKIMIQLILSMRASNQALTGLIMYRFMKLRAPTVPKLAYRKYFTRYLAGVVVSEGVSQIPIRTANQFITDPFVFQINRYLHPRVINKVTMTNQEATRLTSQMSAAVDMADRQILTQRGIL